MIVIAGGTYLEKCIEPPWDELYGSGLRAAAALSELDSKITLSTYVGRKEATELRAIAASYGFFSQAQPTRQTVRFEYLHSLAHPEIIPSVSRPESALKITAPVILRFGLREGTAIVHGERVVYDPQNPESPEAFDANGSTAKRLAIAANIPEATALSGQPPTNDFAVLGARVCKAQRAEVAVIKKGTLGCTVVTSDGKSRDIPVYATDFVWKVGSGDVFAALFAFFWAVKNECPFEAANLASMGTAQYCSTLSLPIPATAFYRNAKVFPVYPDLKRGGLAYLAGPFFSLPERWLIEEAREALLHQGLDVFSPVHDVGRGTAEQIYPQDIEALDRCDAVLACLDGLDAGTIFEIGYARARAIPVIVYSSTCSPSDRAFLERTGCVVVTDLATAVYRVTWTVLGRC